MKLTHDQTLQAIKQGFKLAALEQNRKHLLTTCIIVESEILHILRSSRKRAQEYGAKMLRDMIHA